jgi:hexosaminidase
MKCCFIALLLCSFTVVAQVNIIPQPVSVKMPRIMADFIISPSTKIVLEGSGLENSVQFFNDYLKEFYGFSLETTSKVKGDNNIIMNFEKLDDSIPGAYNLSVDQKGIYIAGDNETGVFYGIQSFIQLLPMPDGSNKLSIAYVEINDKPRFAYRGMMLDVGRHFMPVSFVKNLLIISPCIR